MAKRMDLEALLDSENRLPADLRNRAKPILKIIREHLKHEQDDESWYTQLGRFEEELHGVILTTASSRMGDLSGISDIKRAMYFLEWDLKSEIAKAKYEENPNWKRVVRIFGEVKRDLLDEILSFPIPEDRRKEIYNVLQSVELRLPADDPRRFSAYNGCHSTLRDAMYDYRRNAVTICAGYFNSIQDDAGLREMIAHELAHSFDPKTMTLNSVMKSEFGQVVSKFCGASGPVYSCAEWQQVRKKFVELERVSESELPFRRLTKCLNPASDVEPFESSKIKQKIRRQSSTDIESKKKNELLPLIDQLGPYLRPDLLWARLERGNSGGKCGLDVAPEILVQILRCNGFEQVSSVNVQEHLFRGALQELEQIQNSFHEHYTSACGRDCLAKESESIMLINEKFADWIARRILERTMAREQSVPKRKQLALSAVAWGCENKSANRIHPDFKSRRLSLFSPKIAEMVHCSMDNTLPERAKCDF